MESANSLSRKRPVTWIGICAACDEVRETVDKFIENPHPNGVFCPAERGGGLRGVMHFHPSEEQTPVMIAQDIGLEDWTVEVVA